MWQQRKQKDRLDKPCLKGIRANNPRNGARYYYEGASKTKQMHRTLSNLNTLGMNNNEKKVTIEVKSKKPILCKKKR